MTLSIILGLDLIARPQNNHSQDDDFAIDESICLKALEKIKRGNFSGFSEIDDVDAYIQNLRNEICVE